MQLDLRRGTSPPVCQTWSSEHCLGSTVMKNPSSIQHGQEKVVGISCVWRLCAPTLHPHCTTHHSAMQAAQSSDALPPNRAASRPLLSQPGLHSSCHPALSAGILLFLPPAPGTIKQDFKGTKGKCHLCGAG